MSISEKLDAIPFDNEFDNSKPFVSTLRSQISAPEPTTKKNNPFQFLTQKSWSILAILTVGTLIARLLTIPNFAEINDSVFFVRGVLHYSVLTGNPQWPGYPVYIWVGDFLHLFIADPLVALHLLSVITSTLCLWPIYGLAFGWRRQLDNKSLAKARLAGLGAAVIWVLLPISWLTGSEALSDSLAMLVGLTMLWCCWKACEQNLNLSNKKIEETENKAVTTITYNVKWLLGAALLGGLLPGIRLAYIVLLLPLLLAMWLNRKWPANSINLKKFPARLGLSPLLMALITLVATTLTWFDWQLLVDGRAFFSAASVRVTDHYYSYGDSALTDTNVVSRPGRFLETLVVYGFGGWWPDTPLFRIIPTFLLGILVIGGSYLIISSKKYRAIILVLLWLVPYTVWALFSFDVDLVRYTFPLVALLTVLAGIGLTIGRSLNFSRSGLALVATVLAFITVPLAVQHRTALPIAQQVSNFANSYPANARVGFLVDANEFRIENFMEVLTPPRVKVDLLDYRNGYQSLDLKTWELKTQNYDVYALLTPTDTPPPASEGWSLVARVCRGRFMESRDALEMDLYHFALPNSLPTPDLASLDVQAFQPCSNN